MTNNTAKNQAEQAENLRLASESLIAVFEKLFADFYENLENNARNCRNGDASTALYDTAYAVSLMDIPYLVREALEVPHPVL